jgi:hypothetical protein
MYWLHAFICMTITILITYVQTQAVNLANKKEYDSYGTLLTMNEHLAILAQNDKLHFTIVRNPFKSSSWNCIVGYSTIRHSSNSYTEFVYSVSIGMKQNSNHLVFGYLDENKSRHLFLTVVFLQDSINGCVIVNRTLAMNVTNLAMHEHAIVGMDPYGTRVYGLGSFETVCIDVATGDKMYFDHSFTFAPIYPMIIFPKAMVITEDHRMFIASQQFLMHVRPYLHVVNFINISNPTLLAEIELSTFDFGTAALDINRMTTMSIALDEQSQTLLIGIPRIDTVFFLSYNSINVSNIITTHVASQSGISFGKSVAFINSDAYAVLAYALATPPWSRSQIQVRINYKFLACLF